MNLKSWIRRMETINYTEQELEDAKEFLRRRIENELSMKRDVDDLLNEYAEKLLILLFRDAPDEDINALIDELCSQLLEDCKLLAVDEHDREDEILLYMLGERNGDTLEGRISKRCRTFFNEIFAVYLGGKLLGWDMRSLLSSIRANLDHPWQNEVLVAVREKIQRGEMAGNLDDFAEPHFGRGIEISSMGALETMTGYAIADAWMWWGYEDALAKGAIGYYVQRGSSYPCDECQSHVGIFYPMSDEDNRPQYHKNCCCYVIYSYVERL